MANPSGYQGYSLSELPEHAQEIAADLRRGFEKAFPGPITNQKYEEQMAAYLKDPFAPVRRDMERLSRLISYKVGASFATTQAELLIDQLADAPLQTAYQLRQDMAKLATSVGVKRVRKYGGR